MLDRSKYERWEEHEAEAAAAEAAQIGGRAGDECLPSAQRPLIEAGEGTSEGAELTDEALIAAIEDRNRDIEPEWAGPDPEEEAQEAMADVDADVR